MKAIYLPLRDLPDGVRPKRAYNLEVLKREVTAKATAMGHQMGHWNEGWVAHQDASGRYTQRGSGVFSCLCKHPGCLGIAIMSALNPLKIETRLGGIEKACPQLDFLA